MQHVHSDPQMAEGQPRSPIILSAFLYKDTQITVVGLHGVEAFTNSSHLWYLLVV